MNFGEGNKGKMKCSFCGKTQEQVRKLVAGPGVYICDECVKLCDEIVEEEVNDNEPVELRELPKPREIYDVLNQYVIGQDEAKKSLSVAVYNHYKRINRVTKQDDVELQKSNILMLGPTGSGKTLLAQTLAKILNVPFAIADATSLTEAGYVGEDVENILLKLIQAADNDIEQAQKGIIYIDDTFLSLFLEGTIASVPPQGGRKHPHQEGMLQIDTTNILFICGGAFDGIEKIIDARLGKKSLGFGADIKSKRKQTTGEILKNVLPEDLLKCGLIPEFIGRVPVVVTLESLTEDALVDILVKPKNALVKQYGKLLEMDGVKLHFDEEALHLIAKEALERKTGARGLRSIIERIMRDAMFEIPSKMGAVSCEITKEIIEKKKTPVITYADKKAVKK